MIFRHKKLLALRAFSGLKQKELARKVGISRVALQRMESGQTKNPTLATIHAFAECFDVPIQIFFTDEALSLK